MKQKKRELGLLDRINKEALTELERAMEKIQKQHSVVFNSFPFQQFLKERSKIQEVAEKVVSQLNLPRIIEQQQKQQELMESLTRSLRPNITLDQDIIISKPQKKYSEAEVRFIIEETTNVAINKVLKIKDEQPIEYKFPYKLADNFSWHNITIKFRDGENVTIIADKHIHQSHCKEMGFWDSRSLQPILSWKFLKTLAENNGDISIKQLKKNLIKQKQVLSNKLKEYFNIHSDPFYPYKEEKSYKIKINLLSIHQSMDDIPEIEDDKDPHGIKEDYNNTAISVRDNNEEY